MEKNQIIELNIDDMLDDGRAFGRYEGCAVFVSAGAVPGDKVKARITKAKNSSAEAVLTEITEPSEDRIPAACPYFDKCGGCTLRELSYEAQKRLKTDQVRAKLKRLGGLEDPKVNDIMRAGSLDYYRNKAVFAVGPRGEVGFRKEKSHHVTDIEDCMLQTDAAMVCADALRCFLKETGVSCISQMTVRTAFGTGEVMAVLEMGNISGANAAGGKNRNGNNKNNRRADDLPKEIPQLEKLIGMLDDAVYSLSENPETGLNEQEPVYSLESAAVIRNGRCRIAAGKATITDVFITSDGREIRYEISPQSFFQVNPEQMEKLYDKVAEYAAPAILGEAKDHVILDLYCGAGTIGIWLLDKLRKEDPEIFERTKVIGIESVKPAIIDANRNSVINGLVNTRYICGRAEEELPGMMGLAKLYKWNEVNERVEREPEIRIKKADVAILDPPRAGCAEALLGAVVTASPDRIVYVSCDPGTLARDIKYLCENGYEFIEATPADQFIWTSHIEVCCLLVKASETYPDF